MTDDPQITQMDADFESGMNSILFLLCENLRNLRIKRFSAHG